MVSGLVTSPCDQLRIFSGDASMMRIASKSVMGLESSNGFERNKATLLGGPFSGSPRLFPGLLKDPSLPGKRRYAAFKKNPEQYCLCVQLESGCPTPAALLFLRLGWSPDLVSYRCQIRRRELLDQIRTLDQFDIQAQGLQFANQHVERLRHAGLDCRFALDDGLVDLGAAIHVVRLGRQQFLQDVCCAVCLQRPHFHLAETLSTELRLAPQRLLGDQ